MAHRDPIDIGERDDEGTLLCVTGNSCLLTTRHRKLRVIRDDKLLCDVPWRSLEAVILFGSHQITTQAMHAATDAGTALHLANGMGVYKGVIWNGQPSSEGHQLWLQQLAFFSDEERALYTAREIVSARVRHLKELLRQRNKPEECKQLNNCLKRIDRTKSLEQLRGHEGYATREFFRVLAEILPEEFGFNGRNKRPPLDPFNALLSLGYTLLYGYSESIVRSTGLLPWRGFYHQSRGTHAALASDLMEPFRHVVERSAISLLTRRELKPDDFSYTPTGACQIDDEARRKYLATLVQRFEKPVRSLGDDKPQKLFNHLHVQAVALREWIRYGTPFKAWRVR